MGKRIDLDEVQRALDRRSRAVMGGDCCWLGAQDATSAVIGFVPALLAELRELRGRRCPDCAHYPGCGICVDGDWYCADWTERKDPIDE